MRDISNKILTANIFIILGLFASGCSNKSPEVPQQKEVKQNLSATEIRKNRVSQMSEGERKDAFAKAMNGIKNDVKNNRKYTKIKLDKPIDNRKWFTDNIYKLWSGEMSKDVFINDGIEKYPNKDYEFYFIASSVLSK
ncbi:hypothetical protein MNB_SV-9-219 [hydrothermal vent metagenome]|uniref:Lipoprotein n=1 Tax=hydrothermal vent metagenome TaxID=652676 RepID=A0A1W1BD53_9ZZZZ